MIVQYARFLDRLVVHRSLGRSTMVGVLIGISAGLDRAARRVRPRLQGAPRPDHRLLRLLLAVRRLRRPVEWAYHLVLPWATFAVLFTATYVRMIRAYTMETLNEDYVRTARAKGAPEWRVLRSHVVRNAMLPVVTILGMDIGLALGGAIFTETVFGLPGLGKLVVGAIANFDEPTVEGVVIFATSCIIVFNLAVDTLYAWIDPRIRLT
jgi:ABC-type dipeptide/oligopeptide/nickel transport system permease component